MSIYQDPNDSLKRAAYVAEYFLSVAAHVENLQASKRAPVREAYASQHHRDPETPLETLQQYYNTKGF